MIFKCPGKISAELASYCFYGFSAACASELQLTAVVKLNKTHARDVHLMCVHDAK